MVTWSNLLKGFISSICRDGGVPGHRHSQFSRLGGFESGRRASDLWRISIWDKQRRSQFCAGRKTIHTNGNIVSGKSNSESRTSTTWRQRESLDSVQRLQEQEMMLVFVWLWDWTHIDPGLWNNNNKDALPGIRQVARIKAHGMANPSKITVSTHRCGSLIKPLK